MISVDDAVASICAKARARTTETLSLSEANERVLAQTVRAQHSQPANPVSAMDGYAVRFEDINSHQTLEVVAEAPAGNPFDGRCENGQAIRVFTGSVIPEGADHVVIQEDVERNGTTLRIVEPQSQPRNIRAAGIDFSEGDVMGAPGDLLGGFRITAIASAGHGKIDVFRRPRIGIIANGDELKEPGQPLSTGDVVCSTPYGLMPLIKSWGADAHFTGIAADRPEAIAEKIGLCADDDVLLPIGGASVGDHDHMRSTFSAQGWETVFQKIAVKPGKPTWFAEKDAQLTLGLPGNPSSALVCAILFLKPLIYAMTGRSPDKAHAWGRAEISGDLRANGGRESFLRARKLLSDDGRIKLEPASNQDSSLITPFLEADVLIRRPPNAPAISAESTETVPFVEIV